MFIEVTAISVYQEQNSFRWKTRRKPMVLAVSDIKRFFPDKITTTDDSYNEITIDTTRIVTGGDSSCINIEVDFETFKTIICNKTGKPIKKIDRFELMEF